MTPLPGKRGCSELEIFGDSPSDTGNNPLVLRPNVTDTSIPPNTFVARAIFDTMRTEPSAFRFPNVTNARAARPTCRRAKSLCWDAIHPPSAAHAVLGHAMVETIVRSGSKADLRPSLHEVTSSV